MATSLTDDQLKRIDDNRKRALAIRASKLQQTRNDTCKLIVKPSLIPTTAKNDNIVTTDNTSTSTRNFYSTNPPSSNRSLDVSSVPQSTCNSSLTKLMFPSCKINLKTSVASCSMITRKRFQVDMDYHAPTIEVFKNIPSRCYDASQKRWNFDISDHDRLISDIKKLLPAVMIGGLPQNILNIFKNVPQIKSVPDADLSKLDLTLHEALMPFQKEGVNFGILNNGRVIIADDMGLGKTIQAIAVSANYKEKWPLLVVTPSSVRYAWKEAFQIWLPSLHSLEINMVSNQKDSLHSGTVVIMSYDMLSRKEKEVVNRNFKVIIFDESHFLKNSKSSRTKAALNAIKLANHVLLLSGTPALSRPVELYTQITMVNSKIFPNYNAFGIRYCNGKQMPWGWDFSGSSNMKELQLVLEETVLIRRLKSEVIKQLPSKQRQMIILDPSQITGDKKGMNAMQKEMAKTTLAGSERRGILLQYFHSTGLAKIPAVCGYIVELLEADRKFICFAHHQPVIEAICDLLFQKKCGFIRIDGSTPAKKRKVYCDKFQFSEQCRVAVLSITAANAGINLTAAHLVIFAELFWNPGILTQAEDRAHRIGQQDCVIVQYLVAKGTADDHIWPLVQKKLDILSKAGLSKDSFTSASTVCTAQTELGQGTLDNYFSDMDVVEFSDDLYIPDVKKPKS